MPKSKKSKKGNPQGRNGSGSSALSQLVATHPAAARGDVIRTAMDEMEGPMDFRLVQNPPRNFLRAIHWIQSTVLSSVTTSNIGAVVEANQAFSLQGNVSDYANYAAVFDQYCIHSAVVRIIVNGTLSGSITPGRLHTALDFDNVSNLGSETTIQQYSTCISCEINTAKAVERVVKPCMAPAVWAGGAFSGYAVARSWLNASSTNVPHYGIRVLTAGGGNTTKCDIYVTVIVGFRNNI